LPPMVFCLTPENLPFVLFSPFAPSFPPTVFMASEMKRTCASPLLRAENHPPSFFSYSVDPRTPFSRFAKLGSFFFVGRFPFFRCRGETSYRSISLDVFPPLLRPAFTFRAVLSHFSFSYGSFRPRALNFPFRPSDTALFLFSLTSTQVTWVFALPSRQ